MHLDAALDREHARSHRSALRFRSRLSEPLNKSEKTDFEDATNTGVEYYNPLWPRGSPHITSTGVSPAWHIPKQKVVNITAPVN